MAGLSVHRRDALRDDTPPPHDFRSRSEESRSEEAESSGLSGSAAPHAIPLEELARGRYHKPQWRLMLRFRRSNDEERDHQLISQALPWLVTVESPAMVYADLHEYGLAVIECDREATTRRLLAEVRGWKVLASAFDPSGRVCLPHS